MIVESSFQPAPWLKGAHAQTLFSTLFRRHSKLTVHRERLELLDGDFADCDWIGDGDGPIVIILHGLEGSINSPYAHGLMASINQAGWRGALLHFRGCSGEPNRLATSYHSGFTTDLDFLIRRVQRTEPDTPVMVVGFSLGGNVLLKWLGEQGHSAGVAAAIAVSVPFDLGLAANTVEKGLSRIYNWYLLRSMRNNTARKFRGMQPPFMLPELATLKTFRQFDDAVTAPLNGFSNAADYYHRASSRQFLKNVVVPTLIIQSRDDPITGGGSLPSEEDLSPSITLEISDHGGHVGFIQGRYPWCAQYWLEQRICHYLKDRLQR